MNIYRSILITVFLSAQLYPNVHAATIEEEDSLSTHLQLDEIVVKAVRPFQKIGKGGSIINVRDTPLAKSGSLTDLLERIPYVTRSKEGYEVQGKGTPIIYIDGRKIYKISEIDNLRSEEIANIEVITNPGPEYDAKALAVIRITTVGHKNYGFAADVTAIYSGPHPDDYIGQANASYTTEKFDIFETAKYSRIGEMEKHNIFQTADIGRPVIQKNRYKVDYTTQRIDNTLAFNYRLSPLHSIGARYNISAFPACDYIMTMFSDISGAGSVSDRLTNDIHLHRPGNVSHQANGYYAFTSPGWNTKVSLDYITTSEAQSQRNLESSEAGGTELITAENRSRSHLYALRADISATLGKGSISAGIQFDLTRRNDSYRNSDPIVGSSDGILREKMGAAYVAYDIATAAGEIYAGLRYEHSSFRYTDRNAMNRRYDNVFPSVSWQQRFGMLHMKAEYNSRIQRPRYRDLSNDVIYVNSFCLSTGNPLLRNAMHHEVTLTARWSALTIATSLRNTSDAIVYWGETYQPDNTVTLLKMDNVKHQTKSMTTVTWAPVFGRFSPVMAASCIKQWLSVDNLSFNRPIFTAAATTTLDCGKGWTAMLDFNYRSKGNTENAMLNDNIFNLSASLRKALLDNRLTLQLKMSDILNDSADNSTLYFPAHTFTQNTRWNSRSLILTLRYNINGRNRKYGVAKSEPENKKRL